MSSQSEAHLRPPLTPGRIVYLGWHQPIALIQESVREGGPLAQWITARGRRAMAAAALRLPPLPPCSPDAPEIWMLTGRRFWFETAFCFWSLRHWADADLKLCLVDDGTLDESCVRESTRLFPGSRVVGRHEAVARLDSALPESRFPTLRRLRKTYVHLRKLTDVHAGHSGPRLVLDSDLLFFRRPDFLLDWLRSPEAPLHGVDCQESYGFSRARMESLTGVALPRQLNVGLCGLRSEVVAWDDLERWATELISSERMSYYLEQGLTAMLLAGRACRIAPAADYVTFPARDEVLRPSAVMHHYVATSKRWYFRFGWRHVAKAAGVEDR